MSAVVAACVLVATTSCGPTDADDAAPPPLTTTDRGASGTTVSGDMGGPGAVSTAPALSPDDELAACEARVATAGLRVSFVPEAAMRQGEIQEVGAAVALGGVALPPPPGGGTTPTTVVDLPAARCVLSARLEGAGFEIDPPEPVEQSFVDVDTLTWSWQCTPVRAGQLTLRLVITPVVLDRRGAFSGADRSFTATIAVTAEADERSMWDKTNDFFTSPLGAALLTLAVGLLTTAIVAGARRATRRRRRPPPFESVP